MGREVRSNGAGQARVFPAERRLRIPAEELREVRGVGAAVARWRYKLALCFVFALWRK
jgi:hypothetical protein